jgi:hypothetical protein
VTLSGYFPSSVPSSIVTDQWKGFKEYTMSSVTIAQPMVRCFPGAQT